jgi:hydrogenase maturation protease
MTDKRILVAGVGNVFFGDDGFGPAVASRLLRESLPSGVRVIDFGTRSVHLAYELCADYHAAVLVDVAQRGCTPGTLSVLEPDATPALATSDAHGLYPAQALALARSLGHKLECLRVVACEPLRLEEDPSMQLSEPVAAAVEPAVSLVTSIVRDLSREAPHA